MLRGVPIYVGEGKPLTGGSSSRERPVRHPSGPSFSRRRAATQPVAAALIREAGYHAQICGDLAALLSEIEGGAGLAVIADEAIKTADLRGPRELAQ